MSEQINLPELPTSPRSDEFFMALALEEARRAFDLGEVPVGAVAVANGEVICSAHNQVEGCNDATAHAEIGLIRKCSALRGDWRMEDVTIYVTKEPCAMCAGAMVNARVKKVVFGMSDPRCGGCGSSALNVVSFPGMLHCVETLCGVREEECRELCREFFRRVRNGSKPKP